MPPNRVLVAVESDSGESVLQTGPLTSEPATPLAIELPAAVPVPSLRPQRAIRPLPESSSTPMLFWIWVWVRATFQIRASSSRPAKKPAAVPVEFIAVASDACWMLSKRGCAVVEDWASRLPFK